MVHTAALCIGDTARGLPEQFAIDPATALDPNGRASVCKATNLESGELLTCTKFCKALLRQEDELQGLSEDDNLNALLQARARYRTTLSLTSHRPGSQVVLRYCLTCRAYATMQLSMITLVC